MPLEKTTSLPFEIKTAPRDPITGLDHEFRTDLNASKVNLGIGIYLDADGVVPVLNSVRRAEGQLLTTERNKAYLPVLGEPDFLRLSEELAFGDEHNVVTEGRVASVHTPGGTAALRVAAEFLKDHSPNARVWISNPGFPNHYNIFSAVGFETKPYRYLDATGCICIESITEDLNRAKFGDVVVLHASCHNPTGSDLSLVEWQMIADLVVERGLIPILDCAYMGFAVGISEDGEAIKRVFRQVSFGLVALSYSKNFAIYGERTGFLSFIGPTKDLTNSIQAWANVVVRRLYSSPPAHGSRIVTTILSDYDARSVWEGEVAQMRARLSDMRKYLSHELNIAGIDSEIAPDLADRNGMFSLLKIDRETIVRIREKHSVYFLESGRISIAGLTRSNIGRVVEALSKEVRH